MNLRWTALALAFCAASSAQCLERIGAFTFSALRPGQAFPAGWRLVGAAKIPRQILADPGRP
jgi:hypothetical protein